MKTENRKDDEQHQEHTNKKERVTGVVKKGLGDKPLLKGHITHLINHG